MNKEALSFHPLSLAVTQISLKRVYRSGETAGCSLATGFFWRKGNRSFLVTNWHNFTGRDQKTNAYIGGFCPNVVEFCVTSCTAIDGERQYVRKLASVALLDEAESPLWLEHHRGREVDCAAIDITELTKQPDYAGTFANEVSDLTIADFSPRIGMECFVVGYPKGLAGPALTPIWKRATIASEPFVVDSDNPLDVILVDTSTRIGMSGSPVLARHIGPLKVRRTDSVVWNPEYILGFYSGRVDDDSLGVQIGRVWSIARVDEILFAEPY